MDWRDKVSELSDPALIWIWVHEIDHETLPRSSEHQLVVAELVRRDMFVKAEEARSARL
jgi:hypothetical protein